MRPGHNLFPLSSFPQPNYSHQGEQGQNLALAQKNSSMNRAGVRGSAVVHPVLGHGEQIRKRQDGGEVQKGRNKDQDSTFFRLKRVHFFHAELDFELIM